jgi:predicted  nucleic acid-binding Zn-ribbon protein
MDIAYLFPSAVLATVGTMYAIFVAVAIFSAKYFDQNIKNMRLLLEYFLLLSIVVLITELYNGYILYLQSGGTLASNLHILSKIFPFINFLDWCWFLFLFSILYILLFSLLLLAYVLIKVCFLKVDELKAKRDEFIEKMRDLRLLHERRNENLSELECEVDVLTKKTERLTNKYLEEIQKSYNKIEKACEKEETINSKFTTLEIVKLLYPKKLFDESGNPLEQYMENVKKVEKIENLPINLLREIKEYREHLESLNEEFKNISKLLKKTIIKVRDLYKLTEEIEIELTKLEGEKKEMDKEIEYQLNEIEHTLDRFTTKKIKHFFKKS